MNPITLSPIGIIHTEYTSKTGVPIQPSYSGPKSKGRVEVFPEFKDGLADLDGFSYIILIFYFHKSSGYALRTKPYLEDVERGVFSTRAPRRPNPIGISIVPLEKVEDNILYVSHVDILDGTPLLDIKPYVPHFDENKEVSIGWLKGRAERIRKHVSDDRFSKLEGEE